MSENGYIKISKTVLYDTRLSYGAKLLYGEIASLAIKEGFCFASNSYFARRYNAGPSSITRWIHELSQAGYVRTEYKNKGGNNKERKIYIQGIPLVDNQYSIGEGRGIPLVEASIPPVEDRILNINIKSSSSAAGDETTTTTILNLIKGCKALGYTLDEKKSREILRTGIDPSWLDGSFNYLEYAAEIINTEQANKPKHEQRKLFLSALTWSDRRDEYPAWREQQTGAAMAAEEKRRKDAARATVPTVCKCGTVLAPDSRECPSCNLTYFFNEESGIWDFHKHISLVDNFNDLIKKRQAQIAEGV
jgi:hypothetical protein